LIEITNVHKAFGKQEVLKGVSLRIETGEVVVILGASGSGKTTLLRCINFLEKADQGTLTIGETTVEFSKAKKKDILEMRRKTAFVFQNYNLFENKTALENVTEGLVIARKVPKADALKKAKEALDKVGLSNRYAYYPSQLSGGQQQRVAIARAVVLNPEVILFDEPTSALDPELIGETLKLLKQVAREGITMIVVTHEMSFASDVANKVIFMDDGVAVEEGKPSEIFSRPQGRENAAIPAPHSAGIRVLHLGLENSNMGILIKNSNVFDGKNAALRKNASIVIENHLIREIIDGECSGERFETVIDAANKTVIPGLTDAHVHLSGGNDDNRASMRVDEKAVRSVRFARDMLLRGFTTVRDAGGLVYGLKKNIDDGYLEGPRIFPSHSFITQTCGHGDIRASHAEERVTAGLYTSASLFAQKASLSDGVSEVLKSVRENLFLGASQIKMMAGGGISSNYDPIETVQFTLEEMNAIVNAAADYGTYVMAHLYTPKSMQRAAKAGVRSFEHATLMDEETARIIADHGIWVMPGPQFGRAHKVPASSSAMTKKGELVRRGEAQATELIEKYRLPILFGTDALGNPQRVDEIQLDDFRLFKKRFGSLKGLIAATGHFYELTRLTTYQNPYLEGKIGVLEAGAFADLLIVDGNPVEDLDVLADRSRIQLIMKDAVIYKNTLSAKP